MKKIFVLILIVALSSCSKMTDSRLNGDWYLSEIYSKDTNHFWEPNYSEKIAFSRYSVREISKYADGKEYDFKYKFEISYINDEGGAFYRFSTTSERVLFAYIFDENMLVLIEENSKDKYVYVRK